MSQWRLRWSSSRADKSHDVVCSPRSVCGGAADQQFTVSRSARERRYVHHRCNQDDYTPRSVRWPHGETIGGVDDLGFF
eukprot:1190175-Pyramimonas_sp.AAC.1